MAIKKSQLYSSIWKSCDELRGGMDASQYKDYVLVLLFIKYISDKYADVPYAPITIPEGSSFKDMVALKGRTTIGDDINKKIIQKIEEANPSLGNISVDFNDPTKLGSDKDKVDRLTKLIAIFENPALDFSKNRAEDDDILGDAYEYLMRHFATESGKSKGQFYTPAEVSRIIAKVVGIANTKNQTPTVYDPNYINPPFCNTMFYLYCSPFVKPDLSWNRSFNLKKIEICQSAIGIDFILPLLHYKTLLTCYIIV